VPQVIVYDRTKTVVRRHVGRGEDVPLHPEAIAFASHHGFAIRLCSPRRPQTKGRVENAVKVTREHVLAGRTFHSLEGMQAAWEEWIPRRRSQVHRTHGEVIASRAERDRAALRPLPERPYVVSDRHIRAVGKDALVSFEASLYSVPWIAVRPRQRVELRVTPSEVAVYTLGSDPRHLATHPRARDVTTNHAEGYFSQLKRSLDGTHHRRLCRLLICELDAEPARARDPRTLCLRHR
jgi:hypothetical protein